MPGPRRLPPVLFLLTLLFPSGAALAHTPSGTLVLTAAEQRYVREHPRIRVHYGDVEPFIFADRDERPAGYAAERLERQAGLTLDWHPVGIDQAIADVRAGRADPIPNVLWTPERAGVFLYSERDYQVRLMIFGRSGRDDLAEAAIRCPMRWR